MSTERESTLADLIQNSDIDELELLDHLMSREDTRSPNEDDLQPITPEEAVERYLRRRQNQLAVSSIATHRSSLNHFIRWCDIRDIDDLNELNGRKIQEYLDWRVEDAPTSVDELAPKSEKTQIDITRKFIEICEAIDAVPVGLHERIPPFRVSKEDEVRDLTLNKERMDEIIAYLKRYHYASRQHVIWVLLAEFGPRIGALRALDVDDFFPEEKRLRLRHRPESETPLKKDSESNRSVSLLYNDTVDIVRAYIETKRPTVTDKYGREPLLATRYGRIAGSTIRKCVYRWSCPASIGGNCTCDYSSGDESSEAWSCPNAVSPHPVRRGAITHLLREGVSKEIISDRCDVSPRVIDHHYDARSEKERMDVRRRVIMEVLSR